MVRFCEENEIPFDRCGKVIIATREDELPRLRALLERGTANQVEGLQLVSGERVREEIEPHVNVIEALWAPNTGIVDYRKVSDVYARRFTDLGGTIKFNSKLQNVVSREQRDGSGNRRRRIRREPRHQLRRPARRHRRRDDGRPARACASSPSAASTTPWSRAVNTSSRASSTPSRIPNCPFLGVHFTKTMNGIHRSGTQRGPRHRPGRLPQTRLQPARIPEDHHVPRFLEVVGPRMENGADGDQPFAAEERLREGPAADDPRGPQ